MNSELEQRFDFSLGTTCLLLLGALITAATGVWSLAEGGQSVMVGAAFCLVTVPTVVDAVWRCRVPYIILDYSGFRLSRLLRESSHVRWDEVVELQRTSHTKLDLVLRDGRKIRIRLSNLSSGVRGQAADEIERLWGLRLTGACSRHPASPDAWSTMGNGRG